jgi:hypothetical protein
MGTHRKCRIVKRSEWVKCRCTVDRGRQVHRESSRIDEDG